MTDEDRAKWLAATRAGGHLSSALSAFEDLPSAYLRGARAKIVEAQDEIWAEMERLAHTQLRR